MILSLEEIKHIAKLARLDLTAEETTSFREQLSSILDYFNHLKEVDTTVVVPTSGFSEPSTTLRQDSPAECLTQEELMQNAPDQKDNQFRVPPVLD